ncbi:MAG: hypothetical protein JWO36_2313 [Myxococcales bacterium]|nr:hypothetical protein [Myxococcales bacterium]
MGAGAHMIAARIALSALAACSSGSPPPASHRVDKAIAAAIAAADHLAAPWRCAALDTPAFVDGTVAHDWKLVEHTVSRAKDGDLVIGVVADAGNASPRTIAALSRLRSKLEAAKVDLVITLGGMGSTQGELEGTLGTLSDHATWPVIALAGDLEPETAQIAALATLQKRGDPVIDGRLARWIEIPGVTIGTIPGSGAATRLVAANDGCGWRPHDIAKLYRALSEKPGLRVAAMAEAPREIVGGDPAGQLELVAGKTQAFDVALHAPTHGAPTPARSGARDGAAVALSPGTSDAMTRLPEPTLPSAGVLSIRGNAWSWRPVVDQP